MTIYSDLNSFTPTSAPRLIDAQAVYQSITNIINHLRFQRLFRPEFPGESLDDYLFELIDDISSVEIFRIVTGSVERWEPRVTFDNANTKVTPEPDNNRYRLFLVFKIRGLGPQSFRFEGNLTR